MAKLEEETDSTLTTVAAELKSEVGHLESHLTDLRTTTDTRIKNQDREIGSLSEDLVAAPSGCEDQRLPCSRPSYAG